MRVRVEHVGDATEYSVCKVVLRLFLARFFLSMPLWPRSGRTSGIRASGAGPRSFSLELHRNRLSVRRHVGHATVVSRFKLEVRLTSRTRLFFLQRNFTWPSVLVPLLTVMCYFLKSVRLLLQLLLVLPVLLLFLLDEIVDIKNLGPETPRFPHVGY